MSRRAWLAMVVIGLVMASPALAKGPAYLDPAKADADFALQGEYVGEVETDGKPAKFGAQ